jgi:hypothetical protein
MVQAFPHLVLDQAESDHQKKVLLDHACRHYWLKTGRSTPVFSNNCLGKYEYTVVLGNTGRYYLVRCHDILASQAAKPSRSSGHGPGNPHTRLPMAYIEEIGRCIEPSTFRGA